MRWEWEYLPKPNEQNALFHFSLKTFHISQYSVTQFCALWISFCYLLVSWAATLLSTFKSCLSVFHNHTLQSFLYFSSARFIQMEDVCIFFEDISDPRPIDRCVFPSNDDENYQDKNFPFCLHRKTEQQLGLYEEVWWWGGDCFCSYFYFFIFSLLSGLQLQSTCIFCVAVLFYKGAHIQKHVMWQSSKHTKW